MAYSENLHSYQKYIVYLVIMLILDNSLQLIILLGYFIETFWIDLQ